MSHSTMEPLPSAGQTAHEDPFDLDIRILESSDAAASLINLTDDNCGSSCPKACATNVG
ncbi:FxLD family lanthipeptide [Actinomadura sp. NPDC049382]|uniref:FxLD family lanthipeptide n=1 Tax=Actinomadura TaxID=1988 RepID=UPI0034227D29